MAWGNAFSSAVDGALKGVQIANAVSDAWDKYHYKQDMEAADEKANTALAEAENQYKNGYTAADEKAWEQQDAEAASNSALVRSAALSRGEQVPPVGMTEEEAAEQSAMRRANGAKLTDDQYSDRKFDIERQRDAAYMAAGRKYAASSGDWKSVNEMRQKERDLNDRDFARALSKKIDGGDLGEVEGVINFVNGTFENGEHIVVNKDKKSLSLLDKNGKVLSDNYSPDQTKLAYAKNAYIAMKLFHRTGDNTHMDRALSASKSLYDMRRNAIQDANTAADTTSKNINNATLDDRNRADLASTQLKNIILGVEAMNASTLAALTIEEKRVTLESAKQNLIKLKEEVTRFPKDKDRQEKLENLAISIKTIEDEIKKSTKQSVIEEAAAKASKATTEAYVSSETKQQQIRSAELKNKETEAKTKKLLAEGKAKALESFGKGVKVQAIQDKDFRNGVAIIDANNGKMLGAYFENEVKVNGENKRSLEFVGPDVVATIAPTNALERSAAAVGAKMPGGGNAAQQGAKPATSNAAQQGASFGKAKNILENKGVEFREEIDKTTGRRKLVALVNGAWQELDPELVIKNASKGKK